MRRCRGCHLIKMMDSPHRCLECNQARAVEEAAKAARQRVANWSFLDLRAEAVTIYGGCCTSCGSVDALEFDHVNGDGRQHRKVEHVTTMLRRICVLGKPLTDWLLQLLCHDCHTEKTRVESRERRYLQLAAK